MQYRAYRMRLKEGKVNDYIEVHKREKIWQSVVEGMIKAGYKKMIIFLFGRDLILFEEADDFKKAYSYYESDNESARWDRMISDWMEIYPQFDIIKGDIVFEEIPVVFYFDNGKLLHK